MLLPGVPGARVGRQQCICSQSCEPHQTQNPEEQNDTVLQREQGERGQRQPGTHTTGRSVISGNVLVCLMTAS